MSDNAPANPTLFDPTDVERPAAPTPAQTPTQTPTPAQAPPARPEPPPLKTEVIRSPNRRKTAEARLVGDTLVIRIPGRCTKADEAELVAHFVDKFERSRSRALVDLEGRAQTLARQLDLQTPRSIEWVSNQRHRWGSCTPANGTIRLSDRMAGFPEWVIDYVIVHELAHLDELHHNDRFWSIVARYPLAERARGYLIAKSGDQSDEGLD